MGARRKFSGEYKARSGCDAGRTGGHGEPDRRRAGDWSQCVGTVAARTAPSSAAGLCGQWALA
jgi:hypothetical protein